MHALDLIQSDPPIPTPVFTKDEIMRCPERETCVQCGLCCFGFGIDIPEKVPTSVDDIVRTTLKRAGTICPHMEFDEDGKAHCKCQEVKAHPKLEICREFDGGDPTEMFDEDGYNPRRTGYFGAIQSSFWAILEYPEDENILMQFLEFINRGSVQMPILLRYVRNHNAEEKILNFLNLILSQPYPLFQLLDLIEDLPQWLNTAHSTSAQKRHELLNLNSENPSHNLFRKKYITSLS